MARDNLICFDVLADLLNEKINENEKIYPDILNLISKLETINDKKSIGIEVSITDRSVVIGVYSRVNKPPILEYRLYR